MKAIIDKILGPRGVPENALVRDDREAWLELLCRCQSTEIEAAGIDERRRCSSHLWP